MSANSGVDTVMSLDDDNYREGHSSLGLVAAACILALGLGVGGYFLSTAILKAMAMPKQVLHSITVKGLSERSAKADLVLWPLRFVRTGNDLTELQHNIDSDQNALIALFKANGLTDEEIMPGRRDIVDVQSLEYTNDNGRQNRYILYGAITVRSTNVDAVEGISRKIGEVVKSGVVLTSRGSGENVSLSPFYTFTKLADVKLDMISEATTNGRAAAAQFAKDANVTLGGLVDASQGVISILPGDDYPGATEDQQVKKTLRVVSTFKYAIDD